ncbi:MAG: UDP-N-acetylmuramoyl-L-alanine--D-glutamate ligase [Polyangiaceae bacterium]|nr:UDP-N-acetylmuramoyl-L-alanine--D-glutamate ligase [Polyangiaceae bacterium]
MMDLRGRSVAIVGLGQSGIAAATLCLRKGARVTVCDEAARERLPPEALGLEAAGARLACGPLSADLLCAAELVVVSPGVPAREAVAAAERAGREVVSELELAARFLVAPIALVGGTNGKSTVTALTHAMLAAALPRVFVGGNFGTPLSAAVDQPFDALVVEISSFQAERVPTLHARAAALLNVTEDHLDRYPSFQAYADAKGNPFVRQTPDDVAVIPEGDALCAAQAARGRARVVRFGTEPGRGDVAPEGDAIVDRRDGARYSLARFQLRGRHNLANAAAAVALSRGMGAPVEAVARGLEGFAGLAHRTVLVAEHDGVSYYDDSKGTNVGAAVAALSGLAEPRAVLIAGGRDKQGSYGPLVQALRDRGRALVVVGEAAERIAAAAGDALPVVRAATLAEAVARAAELARPGDAVLLSPACSSYDMFRDYKERGEVFVAAVRALGAARGARAGGPS